MIETDKNEHILFEVRKHWLVFSGEIFALIILAFIPPVFISFVSNSDFDFSKFFLQIDLLSLFLFIYSAWLLILWVFAFIFWTNYYLDVWIITNKRIIDIEQHGLFKREVSILHLQKIQDITYTLAGPMQTLFNYGDVSVQTAGSSGIFHIKGVPGPAQVHAKLNEAMILHNKNLN